MMARAVRTLIVLALALVTGSARGQGAVVSGTVIDSLVGKSLGGAVVQIVADSIGAIPRMVVADSSGRYRMDGIPRGRYLVGFLHPMLDSLSLEPIIKRIDVGEGDTLRLDLALPSAQRLRAAFCGPRSGANSGAAFVGVVRNARGGQPVAGVSVVADWIDIVIDRGGMTHRPSRLTTKSGANGWFALCGVPGPGVITVRALAGVDTTDLIDVTVPIGGFARRDLYVASSRSGVRLAGRVVNDRGGPINSAMVSAAGGSRTRSSGDGAWTLEDVKPGTRILEVRAIGFFPIRRPVDVVSDAPPIRVEMTTFEAVLDTLRIKATGILGADEGGFAQRKRSLGTGKFLSEEDIRRRNPTETSDLLKAVSGVAVTRTDGIRMRSAFGSAFENASAMCSPTVFLDGHHMGAALSIEELDSWVSPSQIAGIEIYHDVPPPQFQVGLSGCGSIVIWTRRRPVTRKPPR
jgi:hypothetical protein